MAMATLSLFVPLLLLSSLFLPSLSQPRRPAAAVPAVPAASLGCNGIELSYTFNTRTKIRPFLSDPSAQPYAFTASASIQNSGTTDLLSWSLLIPFRHRELLVSASPAVLSDASPFPFNTSDTPVAFSGSPNPDLKTPIATANDLSQIRSDFQITGTFFGSPPPSNPLPSSLSLSLSDPSFICRPSISNSSTITACCLPNPNPNPNSNSTTNSSSQTFQPRRGGDLIIFYDVLQAYATSHLAQVTISNESPRGRLDNWRLSWQWMRDEFIYSMKGAYPSITDSAKCLYGRQGKYYQDLDFSKVISCERNPVILDLPLTKFNDTDVGRIPFCCRNGTILPSTMDPSQSQSSFQLQVYKMPPDLNRTALFPPQNWKISGGVMNPNYQCGQPIPVSPTQFPDPSGLQAFTTAVATWQVVCKISNPKGSSPKCCVSFSAFYNQSVVPCKTCACGCPAAGLRQTCNATAPAPLQPPEALLVPFDNRTAMTREYAQLKHFDLPNPMPCGDYCGVSINWHVNADYRQGWSARVTLFNWGDVSFADWFTAVEMGKAYDGYEAMYSFNGTAMGNNTIFMQGLPGLNYLVAEADGVNPASDPRVPGKQQSVISFTKKTTPGIDVVAGDGFPKRVFFNGEECSLPDMIPTGRGFRNGDGGIFSLVLLVVAIVAALLLEQ